MFYRLLLTYFFRCRYLPSVLAAASLPSQSLLCSVLFCKLLLLIAPIFSAIFLCVHHNFLSVSLFLPLSVFLTHFELRLSTFSMSFSSRYGCVCVCLSVCCTYVDLCVRSISWPFVVPSHFPNQCANCQASQRGAGQGGAELSIGLLFRRKLALQIAPAVVVVVVVNYTHVACQLICQVAAGKSVEEKVKQFAIKSTLNLHSSTWGLCLGYLVSSLSKICDQKIFHSPHPPLPILTATANLGS